LASLEIPSLLVYLYICLSAFFILVSEIAAALESVFPQAGLNAFNMMDGITKRTQITQLINIVLGIRLFNREIKKGGAGLEDGKIDYTDIILHQRLRFVFFLPRA
jgi:hypothetical protein